MNDADSDCVNAAWMRHVLRAAGIYNVIWGISVVLYPSALFQLAGIELPRYPQIWQCVGMIVGVYGVGYWVASSHPLRHWPIVLVGLLGKVFGPAGFVWAVLTGALPWSWGLTIVTNDLIWWLPFTAILYQAWWTHSDTSRVARAISGATRLKSVVAIAGRRLRSCPSPSQP